MDHFAMSTLYCSFFILSLSLSVDFFSCSLACFGKSRGQENHLEVFTLVCLGFLLAFTMSGNLDFCQVRKRLANFSSRSTLLMSMCAWLCDCVCAKQFAGHGCSMVRSGRFCGLYSFSSDSFSFPFSLYFAERWISWFHTS